MNMVTITRSVHPPLAISITAAVFTCVLFGYVYVTVTAMLESDHHKGKKMTGYGMILIGASLSSSAQLVSCLSVTKLFF